MAEERIRVLLIDDERSLREPLADYLRKRGFAVDTAACEEEALRRVREAKEPYDILLIDDLLEPHPDETPDYIGIELMREIHRQFPESQAILFTGWGMTERVLQALQAGAYRYLPKPFNPDELVYTVQAAAEYGRIRRERDFLEAMLGIARAMVEEPQVERILSLIADAVPPLLGVEGCSVAYQLPGQGGILSKIASPLGDSKVRWKRHLRDQELTREVIREGAPFYIEDVETAPEVDENLKKAGVRSFIGVPIPGQPERPGVLYAYSTRPGAFDPATPTRRTLEFLADQIGVALRVARLLEETRAEKQKFQTLYEVAREVGACRLDSDAGLGDILKRITDLAVESVRAEEGTLFVVSAEGEVRAWRNTGLRPDLSEEEAEKIVAEGFAGWVIQERRADILPDLGGDSRWIVLPGRSTEGSALGVPLACGEEVVGALTLTHSQKDFFTREHQELLEAVATQAAIVIENAQAYEQRRQQADLLADLARISQALSGTVDLKEQCRLVEEFVRAELGASMFLVALYDEAKDVLRFEMAYEDGKPLTIEERPLVRREDWGLSGYVVKTGKPFICLTREEREKKLAALGIRAVQVGRECATCLLLPLQVGGKMLGVISIQSERPRVWNEVEQDVFSALAGQMAIAMENARRMQELEQMRQAAEAMSRVFEPRRTLQEIVESAARVLGADSAAIWSYDEVRGVFIPEELAAVGIPPEELEKFREEEPKPGRTADRVMREGYLAVRDLSLPEYDFLGQPTRDLLNRIGVCSFQGIALRVGDERLGVLYANYNRSRTFSEDDEAKLRTFASHAALALKNARLLAQMQRTREAAGVIAGVTLQEKLGQTLKTIAQHTQQVLRSDVVTIYSYDEATGRFGEWATEIREPRKPDSARPPEELMPDSVVWSILNLSEPPYYRLAEDRAADDPLLGGRFIRAEEIRAAIGIQLRVGERKVGVMFVDFRSPHRFTSDEIATIRLFADQAAVAIRNARQYDEILRDARLRQGLLQAGQEIMTLQKPEVVLQKVVDIMQKVLAYDVVTLYTYDQDRQEIGFPAYRAGELRDQKSLDELGYISKDSVVGKLLASGEPHFADDAPNDPVMSAGGFVAREGVKSSAGIPLKFGDRVIGIVFVNYRTFHPFPIPEQEALLLFATQVAIAIQNARQYYELEKTKEALAAQTSVSWIGMMSSTWRHAIEKHALTIREQVQLLRREVQKFPRPLYAQERLDTIERLANQILEKPITPPLAAEDGVSSVPINEFIRERTRQLWTAEPYKSVSLHLDLEVDEAATVRASPEWLRRTLDILIDNAVEAMSGISHPQIVITSRRVGKQVEIAVTDVGKGIPEEVQSGLFREPIPKPKGAKGLGLGLLIAQTIVRTYRGEIRLDSTGPTGTTMVISLPLEA